MRDSAACRRLNSRPVAERSSTRACRWDHSLETPAAPSGSTADTRAVRYGPPPAADRDRSRTATPPVSRHLEGPARQQGYPRHSCRSRRRSGRHAAGGSSDRNRRHTHAWASAHQPRYAGEGPSAAAGWAPATRDPDRPPARVCCGREHSKPAPFCRRPWLSPDAVPRPSQAAAWPRAAAGRPDGAAQRRRAADCGRVDQAVATYRRRQRVRPGRSARNVQGQPNRKATHQTCAHRRRPCSDQVTGRTRFSDPPLPSPRPVPVAIGNRCRLV